MPLPSDEKLIALSGALLKQFDEIFGLHPGFRPAHAKGILLGGIFTPTHEAISLTKAPHVTRSATPVTVRFSNSTGVPLIPDNDSNANPRGMAIRFHLGEHLHTDIIGHSVNAFPTRTGDEFLEFLHAVATSDPAKPSPSPIETFLGSHPAAKRFVETPKPAPASFATEAFFGITAMRFTNADGTSRFGRYHVLPGAGLETLDEAAVKSKGANFLFDEITSRIAAGPVHFQIMVQVADEGDVVDDATVLWPDDRLVISFGEIVLSEVVAAQQAEQQQIIFDPIPRIDGIEPSGDPLLELRAAVYLLSGRRRRHASATASA
jgi:catalase